MRAEQRGAATILTVALASVLLFVGAAAGAVGAMVVDHRRAQSAADLAALAGAATLAEHGAGEEACTVAGQVAAAQHAYLRACQVKDREVLVTLSVSGPRWLGHGHDLEAKARAGPARSG